MTACVGDSRPDGAIDNGWSAYYFVDRERESGWQL
jgi:hypothetical protein